MTYPIFVAVVGVDEVGVSTSVPLANRLARVAYWMPRYWSTCSWRGVFVPRICPREGCSTDGDEAMMMMMMMAVGGSIQLKHTRNSSHRTRDGPLARVKPETW